MKGKNLFVWLAGFVSLLFFVNLSLALAVTPTRLGESKGYQFHPVSTSDSITVTSPNGSETWTAGTTQTITWNYTGNPGSNVGILLLKGNKIKKVITKSTSIGSGGTGSCNWPISPSQTSGSDFKVLVASTTNRSVKDTSNNNFTIVAADMSVYPDHVIKMIRVEDCPVSVTITPDGNYAYVANNANHTISVIRTSDNTVIKTIYVGSYAIGGFPQDVAITPDGNYAYVTIGSSNGSIPVIRTSDNTIIKTISMEDISKGAAVTPDGNYVYVANPLAGVVSVIRTSDNTVIKTIGVGSSPYDIGVTPNGNFVYITNSESNTVSVIRTSDNTVIKTIGVGSGPQGIVITPDGNYAYVANLLSNTVSLIRTSDNAVIKTIGVGNWPQDVAITSDGNYAYVTNKISNTVSVIRTSDNTVIETIGVIDSPFGVAITPDGNYAYVTHIIDKNYPVDGIVSVIGK